MATARKRKIKPVTVKGRKADHRAAEELGARLNKRGRSSKRSYRLVAPDGKTVEVPASMQKALAFIAAAIRDRQDVTLVPSDIELTTQEAANLLNVSRQYVVRLVDAGKIPSRKVGAHRRLRLADVAAFKQQYDRQRSKAMEEIVRVSEEAGLYALDDVILKRE